MITLSSSACCMIHEFSSFLLSCIFLNFFSSLHGLFFDFFLLFGYLLCKYPASQFGFFCSGFSLTITQRKKISASPYCFSYQLASYSTLGSFCNFIVYCVNLIGSRRKRYSVCRNVDSVLNCAEQ